MLGARRDGHVVVLELQREERRNALTVELCQALEAAVLDAVGDGPAAGGARAIVVTGRGTAFCSGADLDGVHGGDFFAAHQRALLTLVEAPVPVVAAVDGPAIGGGAQLALACDLRVAGPTARFAVPTARNGLAVDPWTMHTLADVAGLGVARRMLLAADELDQAAALACGLADRAGDAADAVAWAHELAALAPLAVSHAKLVLRGLTVPDHLDADDLAAQVDASFHRVWASDDVQEAARARLERRAPRFKGM